MKSKTYVKRNFNKHPAIPDEVPPIQSFYEDLKSENKHDCFKDYIIENREFYKCLSYLSRRERAIIRNHFFHSKTVSEIARSYKFSRTWIDLLIERSLRKIRLHLIKILNDEEEEPSDEQKAILKQVTQSQSNARTLLLQRNSLLKKGSVNQYAK